MNRNSCTCYLIQKFHFKKNKRVKTTSIIAVSLYLCPKHWLGHQDPGFVALVGSYLAVVPVWVPVVSPTPSGGWITGPLRSLRSSHYFSSPGVLEWYRVIMSVIFSTQRFYILLKVAFSLGCEHHVCLKAPGRND